MGYNNTIRTNDSDNEFCSIDEFYEMFDTLPPEMRDYLNYSVQNIYFTPKFLYMNYYPLTWSSICSFILNDLEQNKIETLAAYGPDHPSLVEK